VAAPDRHVLAVARPAHLFEHGQQRLQRAPRLDVLAPDELTVRPWRRGALVIPSIRTEDRDDRRRRRPWVALEFGPGVFTRTDHDGWLALDRDVVALLEGMAREAGLTEPWLDG
jgi:hypothetical protein